MRNRIVIILLSLLLATPALAGVGAFQKFSMGIMLGLGPSYMTGEDADLYDDNWSAGVVLLSKWRSLWQAECRCLWI